MPGYNLSKLESRFRALDAKQERLAEKTKRFSSGYAAMNINKKVDPDLEPQEQAVVYNSNDYVDMDPKTLRNAETVEVAEANVRASMHHDIAHHVANVKSHVQAFLKQQEVLRTLPTAGEEMEMEAPRQANAEEVLNMSTEPDQFAELFMDEHTFEARQQLLAVSKTVASTAQQNAARVAVSPTPHAPGASPKKAKAPSQSVARGQSQRGPSHQGAVASSPYVNANPLRVPRIGSAKPRPTRPDDPVQPQVDPKRLTQAFFKQLPPVVPTRNKSASLNKKKTGPRVASAHCRPRPATASATSASQSINVPPKEIVDVVYSKAFYHLHVKVLHSSSQLSDWEFSVSVSDVTYPDRILRHTFRNLRVNANMHIVFHPPNNVILSPCDDIPWVASPQSLYKHTFRIEAIATHPTRTKVVDTLVYFGETPPENLESHVLGH